MKTLRALAWVAALAIPLWLSPAARAASVGDLVEDAQELQAAGRIDEAAARLGAALGAAHKKGDIEGEQLAARALDGLLGTGGSVAVSTVGVGVTESERDLLALVLGQLDAKRNGAFVSAPVLARRLLLVATELGDTEHASAARSALAANGERGGRASVVLLAYADGLVALQAGKAGVAERLLADVAKDATYERWVDVATHAATEVAALRHAAGDLEGAQKALSDVAKGLDGDIGTRGAAAWRRALRARLKDAPDSLQSIVLDATAGAAPSLPSPVISDGGFGRSKSTELGRALKRFPKKKPLVTATRVMTGILLKRHFDPEGEQVKPYSSSEQRVDHGGLVITTVGRAVALREARTENDGAKGIGSGVRAVTRGTGLGGGSSARADYLLANGETWGVTAAGRVTISPAR